MTVLLHTHTSDSRLSLMKVHIASALVCLNNCRFPSGCNIEAASGFDRGIVIVARMLERIISAVIVKNVVDASISKEEFMAKMLICI